MQYDLPIQVSNPAPPKIPWKWQIVTGLYNTNSEKKMFP